MTGKRHPTPRYTNTIQMPVTFYTESDIKYIIDKTGNELVIDILYVMDLGMGVPYISCKDKTTGKKTVYIPPDYSELFPNVRSVRRSRVQKFVKPLPDDISVQYLLAELLHIFQSAKKEKKLIEGGVVMRELLRKLSIFHCVTGIKSCDTQKISQTEI